MRQRSASCRHWIPQPAEPFPSPKHRTARREVRLFPFCHEAVPHPSPQDRLQISGTGHSPHRMPSWPQKSPPFAFPTLPCRFPPLCSRPPAPPARRLSLPYCMPPLSRPVIDTCSLLLSSEFIRRLCVSTAGCNKSPSPRPQDAPASARLRSVFPDHIPEPSRHGRLFRNDRAASSQC